MKLGRSVREIALPAKLSPLLRVHVHNLHGDCVDVTSVGIKTAIN